MHTDTDARRPGLSRRPVVIAHRGASGYRPEHTLAAYALGARLGADYFEPDVVPTSDGELVCRHDPEIGATTDVAAHPQFAARRRTCRVNEVDVIGWFVQDFTLAELKTLRAVERLPALRRNSTMYDGLFEVPTLAEVLDLRARLSAELGRELGICPETKCPTFFTEHGLPLETRLVQILDRHGLNHPDAPVLVQSLEITGLRQLRSLGLRTRTLQLVSAAGAPFDTLAADGGPSYAEITTPTGLKAVSTYADAVGPDKALVIPLAEDGSLGTPTSLVTHAHDAGLLVVPFTFRAENHYLSADYRRGDRGSDFGRAVDQQALFFRTGIDGLFADQPDVAVLARARALEGS
jgi:glycerophosphoryl diester phosphodiesterase